MPDKITKGPWVVEERKTLNTTYHMIFSGDTKLCEITVGAGLNKPKREKIARLISAAPDLLDALEGYVNNRYNETTNPAFLYALVENAKAAIARARGQS